MVRITNDVIWVAVLQSRDHSHMCIDVFAGVIKNAVQQRNLGSARVAKCCQRTINFIKG